MIEGLRLLPWWQEAARRDLLGDSSKCDSCMRTRNQHTRQMMGCGFEPSPGENLRPFVQPWMGLGVTGERPTACPGYTTNLPEVIEIARAHRHWSKGSLPVFTGGEQPTESLVLGVEIFEGAANEMQNWCMSNPVKR